MQERSFWDWLVSHTSGFLPPHRYKGSLETADTCLRFEGVDTRSGEQMEFIFTKQSITEVYHGYDKVYSVFQTRSLGLNWAPVRLKIETGAEPRWFYFITGYNRPGTLNKDFYTFLTRWLGE